MRAKAVSTIFVHTFKEAIRTKWLLMFSVVFFLLAVNVPLLVLLAIRYIPPDYLQLYLTYLVSLSFPFVPLLALPIGAASIVEERESGSLQYILSNPISKLDYFVGKTLGLTVATTAVVALGYGIASVVSFTAKLGNYVGLSEIILVGLGLNMSMLGIALLVSCLSRRRATALGIAIFIWFSFTVLSDLGFLSLVVNLRSGANSVLGLILTNPIEISRIIAVMSFNGSSEQLGPTGIIANSVLGALTLPVFTAALVIWIVTFLFLSYLAFMKQDV